MSEGKSKAGLPQPPVTFVNVPLDSDAYYVNANLTSEERLRLDKAWKQMNENLDKPKTLILIPESMTLKQLPSEVLRQWMEKCSIILRERGDALPNMQAH